MEPVFLKYRVSFMLLPSNPWFSIVSISLPVGGAGSMAPNAPRDHE